jgi:ubiquinone/menaquinone biosynthesis C-methylase UbiE
MQRRPSRRSSNRTPRTPDTSWQKSADQYHKIVGQSGHYYHKHVILPRLLEIMNVSPNSRVLDLGCGQGILARQLPPVAEYLGIDLSKSLIEQARRGVKLQNAEFLVKDVTKPIEQPKDHFTHAVIMLALQNMEDPQPVIQNAATLLQKGGQLCIILNHPSFRIPRQSGWNIDERTKQQYRWVNRYLSPLKIPIEMNPGAYRVKTTWSFHFPLQKYVTELVTAGFVVTGLEEWASDKESVGKASRMENRARDEFPLFLCLVAEKR